MLEDIISYYKSNVSEDDKSTDVDLTAITEDELFVIMDNLQTQELQPVVIEETPKATQETTVIVKPIEIEPVEVIPVVTEVVPTILAEIKIESPIPPPPEPPKVFYSGFVRSNFY